MTTDPLVHAEQAHKRGDIQAAEQLAATSSRPEALQFRAMLATQAGSLDEALAHMTQFLRLRPSDANGWFNLGFILAQMGSSQDAEKAYRKALTLAPGHKPASAGLVELLVAQVNLLLAAGKPSQALLLLDKEHSATPIMLDARAAVLNALGHSDEALEVARNAVALAPENLRIKTNLAALLSSQTDPDSLASAARLAKEVLEQHPAHGGANHCLAIVHQKNGEFRQAVSHAKAAVVDQPTVEHWLTLGDQQAVLDPVQGAATLREAIAQLSSQGGDDSAAQSSLDNGALALLQRQLGIALLRADQAAAALATLEEALALAPFDQRTIAHRAVALAATGEAQLANRWLGIPDLIQRVTLACPAPYSSLALFNADLAADITRHSKMRWEPVGLAARNGGLTDNLLADATPAIVGFEHSLRRAIDTLIGGQRQPPPFDAAFPGQNYQLNIWATLVHADGNIDTHIHEESWLSGAYYVQLPPCQGIEGAIEFGRPHVDLPQADDTLCDVLIPKEGELLLFPSYLFHRTLPHSSVEPRISVSFDVSVLPS